jgi:hypothetical protein
MGGNIVKHHWLKLTSLVLVCSLVFAGCNVAGNDTGNRTGNLGVRNATDNAAGLDNANGVNRGADNGGIFGLGNDRGGLFGNRNRTGGDAGTNGMNQGFSSSIQSQLNQSGFTDVHVLVLGDTVIVGSRNHNNIGNIGGAGGTAGQRGGGAGTSGGDIRSGLNRLGIADRGTDGTAGNVTGTAGNRGAIGTGTGAGTTGNITGNAGAGNRNVSPYSVIENQFGTNVRILSVTNSQAIQAIDRVKRNLQNPGRNVNHQQISSDIATILNNAVPIGGTLTGNVDNAGTTGNTGAMNRNR